MDPTRPLVCAEQSRDFESFDITGDCAATLRTILASSGWNKTTYIHPRRKDWKNHEVKWISYFEWILHVRRLIDKLLEVAKTTWWKMCEPLHAKSMEKQWRWLRRPLSQVTQPGHSASSISCMESKAGSFQECLRTDTNLHLVHEKCW